MERYQVLQKIGQGQFGVVKKIRRIADGRIMVWKQIHYGNMSSAQKQQVISEVNILKDLNHPNIIKYFDRIVDSKDTIVYIVMQYCPGGDISSYLNEAKKKKQYFDEDVIWKIFFQLILALSYCHNRERKTLHRDIKPANIFIDHTGSNIKLGDFGLSKQLNEHSQYAKTYVGTPYYMSPQQIENVKYNEKSDIWSVGCIVYELATLKRPFVGSNIYQLAQNIKNGKFSRIPIRYSENLQKTISWMLTTNPEDRPNTNQLLSTVPMLRVRLEDQEIKQRFKQLKKKEEYLELRQQQLQAKIAELRKLKIISEEKQQQNGLCLKNQ